jgi:LuxR family maltose regulon positive regulatory protein
VSVPILTTKLYIPPARPELVSRPRLIERLNEGLRGKLTLISAPAGFGKTTLVSDWLRQIDRPTAWLSLDEGDNDPTRFLTYLIATLQQIDPDIGQTVQAMLQSPQPPPPESLMIALINDIAAASTGFALILDDYHVIDTQHLHDALTYLLDHLPPPTDPSGQRQGMHLVIATRAAPLLPLSRLRSQGQLTELGVADLRFTPDEASAFLNQVMGLALSAKDVGALEARTEGWIAGLQLAALALQGTLSMQGRDDIPAFIQAFTGSHRYILDYLVEEVLRRQPPNVQTFLLQTSILDRLCGSLCDAVLGRGAADAKEQKSRGEDQISPAPASKATLPGPPASSQEVLEYLEQTNLFIIPLDDERRWYRYHHLFADFLQHRLRVTQPEVIPELYLRASVWFEAQGQMGAAIQNALAAEDFERAAGLVEQSARTMVARGEFTTLLGWLKALPDELVRARPQLCLAHAWALFIDEQYEAAESRLQDAETSCEGQVSRDENPEVEALLGEVTAVRATIAFHSLEDMPRAIELSHQALERLPDLKDNLYLPGLITMQLGMAYLMSDDVMAAHRAYTKAWTISQTTDHALTTMLALYGLAQIEVMQGHLHQAAELFKQALQFAAERAGPRGQCLPIASVAYIGMGDLLYEWDNLEGATRHLLEGIELAKLFGFPMHLTDGYVNLARLKQAQGDMDGAYEVLQQAEQFARKSNTIRPLVMVAGRRARLWLSPIGGNLAAAARWAREYRMDDELSYLRQTEHLALARVHIALGQADKALGLLARLQETAESAERMGDVIEMLSLQALAYQAQGNKARAMTALEQALSLAEPEGYVRTFVDEGEPMAVLLKEIASRDVAPSYIGKLLAAFETETKAEDLSSVGRPPPGPLVEPLSERELEVLRLLKTELSGPEIARELMIALTTLRFHTRNIYSKLNVNNRRAAVRRAEELNLL